MPLHPHLHLLLPSSTPSIALEARIYLPSSPNDSSTTALTLLLNTAIRSHPIPLNQLTSGQKDELSGWGIGRIVTAAHPWGKLGGNQLDPVLADHLVNAVFGQSSLRTKTALVKFNSRGIGSSQGNLGLLGLKSINRENDFAAIESWAISAFKSIKDVRRVGYSMGSIAALNAHIHPDHPIRSILLISPPITIFRLTSLIASRPFSSGLAEYLGKESGDGVKGRVWLVHGTNDQFTSLAVYEGLKVEGMEKRVLRGSDHFYRLPEEGEELEAIMREWLDT